MASSNDSVVESKFHTCQLCGKEVLQDNRLLYLHRRAAHMNKVKGGGRNKQQKTVDPNSGGVVENQCKFRCRHCHEVFDNWDATLGHLMTDHDSC